MRFAFVECKGLHTKKLLQVAIKESKSVLNEKVSGLFFLIITFEFA